MTHEKFRRQLRQQADLWREEELIDDSLYQQLSERYQFNSIEKAASNRFILILFSLGGILLGLGIITFVAANWQDWSKAVKFTLLLSIFLAVNIAGFYLWRTETDTFPAVGIKHRFGEGLFIFGALSLGANISLLAQMFHISGSPYGLFLVWGLGVLAMAYGLELVSLGLIAIILFAIGYWQGIAEENVFSAGEYSGLEFILEHTAIIAGILFIPLAYWCQSRIIFIFSLLLLIPALEVNIATLLSFNLPFGIWSAIAIILPIGLLWGYDDSLLPTIETRRFQPLARSLAVWLLGILFFSFSFQYSWESLEITEPDDTIVRAIFGLIDVILFSLLMVWEWFNLVKPSTIKSVKKWGFDQITSVISGFLIVSSVVTFWHISVNPITIVATFIFNIQMFLLGGGLVRIGLSQGNRSAFWGGMVLLTLQIISRTLEYNTELLFKAFVFTLCGIGVMIAGLWFERHLSRQH
ncbi:MAG: DUF2157 domain-containing protein [Microcoleaceae cyanobacterium]